MFKVACAIEKIFIVTGILLGFSALVTCHADPVLAQVQPLPRAQFDPQYMDVFGGSPETSVDPRCLRNPERFHPTDETGWTFNHKDFFIRLQIKEILRQLFEKEPRYDF